MSNKKKANRKRNQQPKKRLGRNIDVSISTFERLQKFAEPLTDTPNDAVRKILHQAEAFPNNIPTHIIVEFLKYLGQHEQLKEDLRLQREEATQKFMEYWEDWEPSSGERWEEDALQPLSTPWTQQSPDPDRRTDPFLSLEDAIRQRTNPAQKIDAPETMARILRGSPEEIPQSSDTPTGRETQSLEEDTRPRRADPKENMNQAQYYQGISSPEYQRPTLRIIEKFGGRAHVNDIIQRLEEEMADRFSPKDLQANRNQRTTWKTRAQHAREILRKNGLIKTTDQQFVWAITPEGRRTIEVMAN